MAKDSDQLPPPDKQDKAVSIKVPVKDAEKAADSPASATDKPEKPKEPVITDELVRSNAC